MCGVYREVVAACGGMISDLGSVGKTVFDYVVGTWQTDEPSYVQFNEDGSYSIAFSIEGLEDAPVEEGEFTLEGTLLTLISGDGSQACNAGERGTYEIEVLTEGRVRHRFL